MPNKSVSFSMIAALVGLTLLGLVQAQAQQGANLSGIYWCDPQPSPCPWPGASHVDHSILESAQQRQGVVCRRRPSLEM